MGSRDYAFKIIMNSNSHAIQKHCGDMNRSMFGKHILYLKARMIISLQRRDHLWKFILLAPFASRPVEFIGDITGPTLGI